ncbi:hypothetical protein KC318_g13387 [Hortaea werneckii]|nr:hypothetical protein KC334_g13007 [Hortaea werneckii]KAI6988354.1 hypothetical protein KC355_g10486 [Hortaea werneckii]KAI7166823.1 hypothetical protein KC324_g11928 [Hortaea werneckii]KAI7583102.1 hypothetical protein KC316_g7477 [Hortaea werneckii]KAI7654744.1 hypothetical protein KC318_g13387 [Hortaea werneckii]
MPGQTTLLASIAILALMTIVHFCNRVKPNGQGKQLPPGPQGLPIIGNVLQMPKRLPWLEFYRMSREYGPVMYMNLAGQSAIILSTHQAAHDLLSVRSALYSDRPRVVMAGELAWDEPELREAKKVLAEYEQTAKPGAYLVDAFPALNYLPRPLAPWKNKAEQLYEQQANLHLGNLSKALQQERPNVVKLMHASQEAKEMTEVELAFSVGVLADAAIDTSAMTLNWLIIAALSNRAEWVQKAQSILDKVVGRDRLPEWEDRAKLTYVDAIINEVLRWRPIIAGGVPHFTKNSDIYGAYYIPANTIVLPNLFAIARDETTFGPEADTFIPERWIDANGKLKDLPDVGFGFGRRICAGRHIARNGLFIKVARLLWAFHIEPGVDRTTGETIEVSDMDCVDGLVVLPKPFKAVFRPRCDNARDVINSNGKVDIDDHLHILNEIF